MTLKHKHLKLDQAKITKAKAVLGTKTETDTIDRALSLVLEEDAIIRAHNQVRGAGGFEDPYASDA